MSAVKPLSSPTHSQLVLQETADAQETRIVQRAQEIIAMQPGQPKDNAVSALFVERAQLLINVSGSKESFALDMNRIGRPGPQCLPTIAITHPELYSSVFWTRSVGNTIASIRLHQSAMEYVPAEILNATGSLDGKTVDLSLTTVDASSLTDYENPYYFRAGEKKRDFDRPYSLHVHSWIWPNQESYYLTAQVQMGIFPQIGVKRYNAPTGVAVDSLETMQVNGNRYPAAHFARIPESPFGLFWSVVMADSRVAITQTMTLFQNDDPICNAWRNACQSDNLFNFLGSLRSLREELPETYTSQFNLLMTSQPISLEQNLLTVDATSQKEQTPVATSLSSPARESTPKETGEAIVALCRSDAFKVLAKDQQKEQVITHLNRLEEGPRNGIFGKIWELSQDPQKGGHQWGENHVADDLGVLIQAISNVLHLESTVS